VTEPVQGELDDIEALTLCRGEGLAPGIPQGGARGRAAGRVSPLLSTFEAADYLGIPRQTLAVWRSCNGHGGPAYVRLGRYIKYRIEDLDEFIRSQRVVPRPAPGWEDSLV